MLFISSKNLFSFLRYLNFSPDFFDHVEKQLDKKAKINFKMSDVTNWITNITIHILSDFSKSNGNQIIRFGQLMEYNVSNVFFKNHAENEARRLVSDLFLF